MNPNNFVPTKWPLDMLTNHPRYDALFPPLPDDELHALAKSMKENGLRSPLHFLEGGVILFGHERCRAARLLDWTDIDAGVRHDLTDASPDAIEKLIITDNLEHRHLSPLVNIRCLQRLWEIDQQCSARELGDVQKVALLDAIARRLNLSQRSVNRYLQVLRTPTAVQAAYERGELTLTAAGRVAQFVKADQERVAQQIEAGGNAAAVVEALLRTGSQDPREVQRTWERFVRYLAESVDRLDGRVGELPALQVESERETLLAAQQLLVALLKRAGEDA